MSKVNLRLDWCSFEAAKYAVMHWHYSKRMPVFKRNMIGVWENADFIGAIVFSLGGGSATNGIRFGLRRNFDLSELARVALTKHQTPISRILSIACKLFYRKNPSSSGLVSFADTAQGHHGGIYQAAGWIYAGAFQCAGTTFIIHGCKVHRRTVHSRYGQQGLEWLRTHIDPKAYRIDDPPKHRYLFPFTDSARQVMLPFAQTYPKRIGSADSGTGSLQLSGSGASPTSMLHTNNDLVN